MSLILNIDTAIDTAYISIAKDGIVLQEMINENQRDHAAFLQVSIQALVKKMGVSLQDLSAIAVAEGPGSYTGLRVGMASAKGLCYALTKPLIAVGNLQILTRQAIHHLQAEEEIANYLFCPMIDARRMEVYTASFSADEKMIEKPRAIILEEGFMHDDFAKGKIVFLGNGSSKWHQVCTHENAIFITAEISAAAISQLSYEKFCVENFADVAYAEPFYLKEFFTTVSI